MNARWILVGVLIAGLLVAGCSPRKPAQGVRAPAAAQGSSPAPQAAPAAAAAPGASTAAAPAASTSPAASGRPAAPGAREGAQRAIRLGPVAQPPPVTSELQGTDRLLPLRGDAASYPYDFEIGPLAHGASETPEHQAVDAVVESFFASFANGTIDESIVSARWIDSIHRELRFAMDHKLFPTETRIGQISVSGDGATVPVRLALGSSRASGTVYLELADRSWYISDVQIDWSDLTRPFVRSEQYEPTSWQWLLKR